MLRMLLSQADENVVFDILVGQRGSLRIKLHIHCFGKHRHVEVQF